MSREMYFESCGLPASLARGRRYARPLPASLLACALSGEGLVCAVSRVLRCAADEVVVVVVVVVVVCSTREVEVKNFLFGMLSQSA